MWTDLSTVLSQLTRVTDGQTDGQTDRILIARPRLHSMQRGKNGLSMTNDTFKTSSDDLNVNIVHCILYQCCLVSDAHPIQSNC